MNEQTDACWQAWTHWKHNASSHYDGRGI